jgi:RNA polymerase sigma-70 factor (ECF subfamily)
MTPPVHADRELTDAIDRARRGDAEALGVLYARYQPRVRGYVKGLLGDRHEADDITQQLFARLGPALERYEPRSASFSAWILRVARNAALDHLRARVTLPLEELGTAAAACDDTTGFERRACLRQALAALPADQRQVVLMRHVVGLTTPEIAAALGRTEGSVHALHHRGRAGLRRRLGELGLAPAV